MESNRWKFLLVGTIGILPLVFLLSHSSANMIPAEKEIPNESLFQTEQKAEISLKKIFTGKHTFVYFGFLDSQKQYHDDLKKFLSWFENSEHRNSQIVFITLAPEKDSYKSMKEHYGNLGDRIIFLKPKNSGSALELARSFGIQAYIVPELGNLKFEAALVWVDDTPKIRGIFPKFSENLESIKIPQLLVQAK